MIEWTETANRALDDHVARLRPSLASTGADAAEVADDLRRHVETEAAAERLIAITEHDARRILARMGPLPEPSPSPMGATPPAKSGDTGWSYWSRMGAVLLFGVLLPLGTLLTELATHMCAGTFFDPIPTWWHVGLVALVTVANLAVIVSVHRQTSTGAPWIWVLNGVAVGVALIYSFLFLPLMPFAAIGIIFYGFGFLPLAPCLALLVALRLRHRIRKQVGEGFRLRPSAWWGGFAGAVLALVAFALPAPLTRHWERMAASEDAATALDGAKQLRRFGHRGTLLQDCYGATRWSNENPWNFSFGGVPAPPEKCREIYFRVTGDVFNSVRPPQARYARGGWNFLDEFDWDSGLGADAVGGRVTGLSMIQSRLDALANADAGHAYVEWTMEFRNDHRWQPREARAQIQLPPGSVVSRLTLWVNGEEREAAFAGRSETRAAYQKVAIQQRRDPVLVTTCGADRVLMQCFPVPAAGGTMKIRVGITAPLVLTRTNEAVLKWPCFAERNFRLRDNLPHLVWLESAQKPIRFPPQIAVDTGKTNAHALRGTLPDAVLASADSQVRIVRAAEAGDALATDRMSQDGAIIRRRIKAVAPSRPPRLVVVLDGGKGSSGLVEDVAQAFQKIPDETEFSVLIAEDGVREAVEAGRGAKQRELAAQRLRQFSPGAGHDNAAAVVMAMDRAMEKPGAIVLWLHDTQPILLEAAQGLQQRLDWRPGAAMPEILDFQFRPGPNRVAETLDALRVTTVPRLGSVRADLERLFGQWNGTEPVFSVIWERESTAAAKSDGDKPTGSRHLARLWALGEIRRLTASRDREAARQLATRYQLVTPISGAVVLEMKEQFQAAGLTPADPMTVPVVPEPSTWALMILGAVVLLALRRPGAKQAPERH